MTNNLIVTPEAVSSAGSISYWRLSGPIDLAALTLQWKINKLDEKLLPVAPGDAVALGRAVHEEAVKRVLVRPLARRGMWAVVAESAGEDSVGYATMLTVKFENGAPAFTRVTVAPDDYEACVTRIRAAYDRHRGELAPEDISAWLVKLAGQFQSVPLRDTGGIYFVPRTGVEFWRHAVWIIECVSAHRVFQIPALKNSEAIDAITDAISQEVDRITTAMEAELQQTGEDALGERAIETRSHECQALLAKVSAYDELLGAQLKCRSRVENLQAMIATAALAA